MRARALVLVLATTPCAALLQPVESITRTVTSLCGVWQLDVANFSGAAPVPSSFDELGPGLAESFAGVATYSRTFFVPAHLLDGTHRLVLRFDSANYRANVFVDGVKLVTHSFAGMPFEAELPAALLHSHHGGGGGNGGGGGIHTLRVEVDNFRSWQTIPPGIASTFHGRSVNLVWEGLYNFAGLDGRVSLLSMPRRAYVADLDSVTTSIERRTASVPAGSNSTSIVEEVTARLAYSVLVGGDHNAAPDQSVAVSVFLSPFNRSAAAASPRVVANATGAKGELIVPRACLWVPLPGKPCLYVFSVELRDSATSALIDAYSLRVGLRTVDIVNGVLRLNGRPLYLRGLHAHIDAPLRGRGHDDAHEVRDVQSIVAARANWVRIHPPPSESMLNLLDEAGIFVSAEVPAIGMRPAPRGGAAFMAERINATTLAHHKAYAAEYVARDKNRACVLLWSVANEPAVDEPASEAYFAALLNATRPLDPQRRPVTYVTNRDVSNDVAAKHVDLICANRYFGWYTNGGSAYEPDPSLPYPAYFLPTPTAHIAEELAANLRKWRVAFPSKPLLVSEYGAGSFLGVHAVMGAGATDSYSAERRAAVVHASWEAFDKLRSEQALQGEQLHALHDFKQYGLNVHDVGGLNYKGLYTRDRQPKDHMYLDLSGRYAALAGEQSGVHDAEGVIRHTVEACRK
jgi:beta-glucuronidase